MKNLILILGILALTNMSKAQEWKWESTSIQSAYTSPIKYGYAVANDSAYTVIGAPGLTNSKGAVFILDYDGENWNTIALLTASDGESNDQFGISVSIYGDKIVVGAMGDDDNGTDAGAVYVFKKPSTGWTDMTETAKLLASDGEANDIFGKSVCIYGNDIVVGAHLDDDKGTDAGAAYVFTKPVTGWVNNTETAKLLPSDGAANESFGHSVSMYNNTVVIGAMWDDVNGSYSGSAYIFTKPESGWSNVQETAKLLPSNGKGWNYFGNFVDIYEDDVIIGSGANQGYVFSKPVTGWTNMTETAILTASDGPIDWFANAVSIYGNTIVLGAEKDDSNNNDEGSIYIYAKPASGWVSATENQKIPGYLSNEDDYFGHAVSIFDNSIIVGAYNKDILLGFNVGAAYLFKNCISTSTIDTTTCNSYISPSGKYTFTYSTIFNDTITNQAGCDSIITINLTINYSDTATDVITACNSYTWIDGITYTSSNNSATYTLTNINGCDSVVNLDLTIKTVDTSVNNTSPTLTANANGAVYQWLDCNNNFSVITGETNRNFTATTNGSFAVEVTENECTDTSACYTVANVGIVENTFGNTLTIYPNPTTGNFVIDLGNVYELISIKITNTPGQIVYTKKYNQIQQIGIDLDEPTGMYFVAIESPKRKAVIRLLKK